MMQKELTETSPLAIVGIGCLFPKAAGPGFYWTNVKHAADCITAVPPTHWDPADYFDPDPKKPDMTYARRGGFLSAVEFDPLETAPAAANKADPDPAYYMERMYRNIDNLDFLKALERENLFAAEVDDGT